MNNLEFTALTLLGSLIAGVFGALTGLGGGIVIVPMLTLLFGVDIRYAAGASLVSVIATSSGAAAAYVREGFTNIRIGTFLGIATTAGAIAGAFAVAQIRTSLIAVIFGLVLLYAAWISARPRRERPDAVRSDPLAVRLKMDASYPTPEGVRQYHVRHVPQGFGLMFVAGALSGLLGIGSGVVKVLAMDQVMLLPFKVSTTTSNFMIGVTAAASAGVYLTRGYVDPGLAMPVMLGVLGGSLIGARILFAARPKMLRIVFSLIVMFLALQMIYNGLKGNI